MASIKRSSFAGMAPAIADELLNEEFAVVAHNVDLLSGQLVPLSTDLFVRTLRSNTNSIYKYKPRTGLTEYWMQWTSKGVSAVHGPVPTDKYDRLYWTEPGRDPQVSTFVKITAGATNANAVLPNSSYNLGVPAPLNAPTVTTTGVIDVDQTPEDVSYIYTLVTDLGEEGPPSKASVSVSRTDSMTVNVNMPAADWNFGGTNNAYFIYKRLYRSNSGSNSTEFQLVRDNIPIFTSNIIDTASSSTLGEVCPSTYWIPPPNTDVSLYPEGPMQGLIAVANGIMAGFSGRRLCLSEPYLPHAWPVAYRITLESEIVAIRSIGNGIIVLTQDAPYFVTGTDPSAMTAIRVDLAQACINADSVVDMGTYILYASPDGLCAVSGAEGEVMTEGLIIPREWMDTKGLYSPRTLKAFKHEDEYVAFWTQGSQGSGNQHKGFIFDPRGDKNTLATFDSMKRVYGGYHDPNNGELYVINDRGTSSGNEIVQFQGEDWGFGSFDNRVWREIRWLSKKYVQPRPVSMSWVYVDAVGTATVRVFVDDVLIADYTVAYNSPNDYNVTFSTPNVSATTLREPFIRLPSVVGKTWQIEVSGKTVIRQVGIAQSIEELRMI